MQLTDHYVLQQALAWLQDDQPIWLCTIVATYGSAPRPIGSLFATDGHDRVGSISGGCLEEAFVTKLKEAASNNCSLDKSDLGELAEGESVFTEAVHLFSYGNHIGDKGSVLELPCGGTITLLIERLQPDQVTLHQFTQWVELAEYKKPFQRQVCLRTGQVSLQTDMSALSLQLSQIGTGACVSEVSVTLSYSHVWQLLILGISQVSYHVAQLGITAGYEVKICDMREELQDAWHFTAKQGGVDVTWLSPDLFVDQYCDEQTAVLALAHDPRIDDIGLMGALESSAFYIGAMGSVRTSEKRVERLHRIGEYENDTVARLHAPIGLDIGSKTPMEIAIAIMADIIAHKNKL
jgi:xanthine dehydrogenase accessory factor